MDSRLHSDNLQKVIDDTVKGCGQVYALFDERIKKHLHQVASSFIT